MSTSSTEIESSPYPLRSTWAKLSQAVPAKCPLTHFRHRAERAGRGRRREWCGSGAGRPRGDDRTPVFRPVRPTSRESKSGRSGRFGPRRANRCSEMRCALSALKSSVRGLGPKSHQLLETESQNRPRSAPIGATSSSTSSVVSERVRSAARPTVRPRCALSSGWRTGPFSERRTGFQRTFGGGVVCWGRTCLTFRNRIREAEGVGR